jgi:hypothetical protein
MSCPLGAIRIKPKRSLPIADQTGKEDVFERGLTGVLKPRHDHARDPEKDNIRRGYEIARGIKFRPRDRIHRFERPEPARKPSVEHVRVLLPVFRVGWRLDADVDGFASGFAFLLLIPDGNAMTPPELTTDAPILDVLQPVLVDRLPALRSKANLLARSHRGPRFLYPRISQKPLLAQARLDRDASALAEPDGAFVRFFFRQKAALRE